MNLRSEIDSNRFGCPVAKAFSTAVETVESAMNQSKSKSLRSLLRVLQYQ